MKKKIFALTALFVLCFGSIVFAQNSNSSTTMAGNQNMSNGNMSGHRRHRRHRKHRRGRRGNPMMMSAPTNKNG